MRYGPEEVAAVREATDLVALVSERTQLRRQGRRFVGLCPFHDERTPSFTLAPETGLWHCFGCGASGDAISFVRETTGGGFREALEALAARAGVALRGDGGPGEPRPLREAREALAAATAFYAGELARSPAALAFLDGRGITAEEARRWRLGWAPGTGLVRALRDRGVGRAAMERAGLLRRSPAGAPVEVFRRRIVFPVADAAGAVVGFGGRLAGPGEPKYLNTAETPLYRKSEVLYGLDRARAEIVRRGEAVVCEGYTDVIAFAAAGAENVVAPCGTAFTEAQLRVLSRFCSRLVLAFDGDPAGRRATRGACEAALRAGLDAAVAPLPDGEDPASLRLRSPAALAGLAAAAVPALSFLVEGALAGASPASLPEEKVAAARAAAEVVGLHRDPDVRRGWVALVSERTGVPARRLARLARAAAPREPVRPAPPPASASAWERDSEAVLAFALADERALARLDEALFPDGAVRDGLRALKRAPRDEALGTAEEPARSLLWRLAVAELDGSLDEALCRLAEHRLLVALDEASRSAARAPGADAARQADAAMALIEGLLARVGRGDAAAVEEVPGALGRPPGAR